MKATVTSFFVCVNLGLFGWITPASVLAQGGAFPSASATPSAAPGNPQREAETYLKQARQAIKDQKFELAQELIGKAEATNVKYDPVLSKFQDTPERLKKLLADEQARATKAGGRFPAFFGFGGTPKNEGIPQDPLAAAGTTATGAPSGGLQPANPNSAPAREDAIGRMTDDQLAKAKAALDTGRQALAQRNIPAAVASYQQAIAFPARFAATDYKPSDLAAELQKAGVDVARLTPANNQPTAPYLMTPPLTGNSIDRLPNLPGNSAGPPAGMAALNPNPNTMAATGAGERVAGRGNSWGADAPPPAYPTTNAPAFGQSAEPGAPDRMEHPQKQEAMRLIAQAQTLLDRGQVQDAYTLAQQADSFRIPDAAFGANETRPWQVLSNIDKMMTQRQGMALAGGNLPQQQPAGAVAQGVYVPERDNTRVAPVRADGVMSGRLAQQVQLAQGQAPGTTAYDLWQSGLRALEQQDRATALSYFKEAWKQKDELDPNLQKQLSDKLTNLRESMNPPRPLPALPGAGEPLPTPLDQAANSQQVNQERLAREIANEHKIAQDLSQSDPRGAMVNLQKLRERVNAADINNIARKQMLSVVDRYISELDTYITANLAAIENRERNEEIRADMDKGNELKLETQQKLAELVEEFNKLLDERRFSEAEIVAKQANEIAPKERITEQMMWQARFVRNISADRSLQDAQEKGWERMLGDDLTRASIANVGDENPLVFGPARQWTELTLARRASLANQKTRLSPAEMEIERALSKPVEAKFENAPLREVLQTLGTMVGVNVHIDEAGLGQEAVTSNSPVNLNLTNPISFKSALNLILSNYRLSYVIQNEVLLITSEQNRKTNTYAKVYYVADLVTPIPNFTPSYNMGLPGALKESMNSLAHGGFARPAGASAMTIAENAPQPQSTTGLQQAVMAQMNGGSPLSSLGNQPGLSPGPGGMGGGVEADFDSLIQLITQTIQPTSWQEVGGPGSIEEFRTNLSLVVSQTQEVHEQIADLLEQLRKLQDLQVTIEVRFITLSDSFFERIGVDFDFNIDDNSGRFPGLQNLLPGQILTGTPPDVIEPDDNNSSFAVGINQQGFTPNLDFQFRQNGFGSATPTFGGFDPNAAATFGFAILSDIEVFLLLNAVQGDDRTNVLQAPKVTLFNGQQAFVSDTSQRPFVTSVVPVVGDFAAANMPVIVVLSEGTSLSVQAVVSADRRFCRLTMVPFFSQIGDVETFTFTGRVTTNTGTSGYISDPADPDNTSPVQNNAVRTTEGTTVQLPTFAFTTVATTVSVPDGGTVLLGGVKRLREGRRERGVPLLSKIPYVSRLFRNVGIGRDAQSLMMMVTPRIIIQEEEEDKLGIAELPK